MVLKQQLSFWKTYNSERQSILPIGKYSCRSSVENVTKKLLKFLTTYQMKYVVLRIW